MNYEEYLKAKEMYENNEEAGTKKEAKKEVGKVLKITDATALSNYSKGHVVQLPPFGENEPFIAKLKRPSLLMLAKSGKIPNALLSTASELFNGQADSDNETMLADIYDICYLMAEAALVEPSMVEIKEAGLDLTDEQLMAIFNYTQSGVKALENFR